MKLLRKAERAHASTLYQSIKSSSESTCFWSFIKSLTGKDHRAPIPDLVSPDKSVPVTSASDKAEVLNSFFAQQSSLSTGDAIPDVSELRTNPESFSSMHTTPSDVFDVLSSLPIKKAAGIDGITPRLLRSCARSISCSLATLFNRSFAEEAFPSAWKMSLVVPVFKRGDNSNPSNYRPIALLSVVGKVCERVVFNKLYQFISLYLADHQSGFRKRDSTTLQLVRLIQSWSEAVDSSKYVGAIFFDLRKAFDRVWHKASSPNCKPQASMEAPLIGVAATCQVACSAQRLDGAISSPAPVLAGVPQGAILSPLLFLIYVNDIPHSSEINTNLFADDTSAYCFDSSPSRLACRLQSAADLLSKWFNKWFLSVNVGKSATMVFRSQRMKEAPVNVSLNGSSLSQVQSLKHLGVVLNETLSWSDHIDAISKKAAQRTGLLRRLRKRLPSLAIRHLYCSSIRPLLEYASIVWCGLHKTDAVKLERLQRRAARLVARLPDLSMHDNGLLLARAGLAPLSKRRDIELAVFAFRFRNGSLPDHIHNAFPHWSSKPPRSCSLRSASSFRLPRPKKSCLKVSPLYLSLSAWNSLPPSAHDSPSPTALKSLLSVI